MTTIQDQIHQCGHNEFDVAMLTKMMFSKTFVSVGKGSWYVCDDTTKRWALASGDPLSIKIATDVFDEFIKAYKDLLFCAQSSSNEYERNMYIDHATTIKNISNSLKCTAFKTNILTECEVLMRDSSFMSKLDSKTHLVAFTNGIVDMHTKSFRAIQPDDYISA